MKTQKIVKMLSILMIVILGGCGGATPTSTQNNIQTSGIEQYPQTKNDINTEENIIWGGHSSTGHDTQYLKSLQEYIIKKMPEKYNTTYKLNKYALRKDFNKEYRSNARMRYSQAYNYCKELGFIEKYPQIYRNDPNHMDYIQCMGGSSRIPVRDQNTLTYYNFLTDQKKISIFTNYLITKKYKLKKDKFEKTSSFQKRVQYVKDNIQSITNKYMSIAYNEVYGQPIIKESNYDADNELFYGVLKSSQGNLSEKIAVSVPLDIARSFYSANKKAKVIYEYKDGKVYLKNIIISYGNKNYLAVLNKMNYKPSELKVALYQDIEYGEKLIAKLNNDIPKLLKQAKSHKIDKHKWLFIIGIENYEYTNPVKYSTNSAKEFKAVMKKRLGIPENNIRTLINKGATSSKIDYRLKDMLRRVKKGDTIYFYYSGHGIPVPSQNNAPYMLAQDMNPAYLNDERFKLQTIYKELSKSKASKVIAFIDSCFSGGTDNQVLIKGVAATRIKPKKTTFDSSKMVVISAGSGTQYSNKYDEKTNRLFSYYVMRGLIKNNTDTQRLYDYVKSNVQEKSYEMGASYEQVPVYDGNIKLKL